ncbi:MAG: hypothetical protein CMB48_05995 [Euryarchaeota archaeon]|nr:hypothetical protein [Euryarchaeota archaeon]
MEIKNYKKRHSVSYSMDYEISIEKMWELISTPGHLNYCHPFCKSNEIINWKQSNYRDELIYLNGLKYIRNFINWDPNKGYDLLIGKNGGPQSYVVWELTKHSELKCSLKITVFPYLFTKGGRILSYIPFFVYVKPRLKKYLYTVLSGFNYYIKHEKDVPRNHFGKHPWFS